MTKVNLRLLWIMHIFTGLVLLQFINMRIKHLLPRLPKNFRDLLESRACSAMGFRLSLERRRSRRSVLVVVVMGLFVGVIAIGIIIALTMYGRSHNQHVSRRKYYYSQLEILSTQINAVQKIIEQSNHEKNESESNSSSDDIKNYESALSGALGVCRQLDDYKIKPSKSDNLDTQVASVNRLCHDLEGVLDYAYRLSIKSKGFMQYQINPNGENYSDTSHDISTLLTSTAGALEQLKADPIGDPAAPELAAYIGTVQKAIDSSSDNASLSKVLGAQQKNFINARRYFWKTTIDIDALESSITKLQQKFK